MAYFVLNQKKIKAFSLIEIGIVLLVIGVLMTAVFKGKDVLFSAKLQTVAHEVSQIQNAYHEYIETYHAIPGDDPQASRFGNNVQNGNGNRVIDTDEASLFWIHLNKAGLSKYEKEWPCKIGGVYHVVKDDHNANWLVIEGEGGSGILTPKQAKSLEKKINQKDFKILNGANGNNECVTSDALNLKSDKEVCIVKVKLS